MPLGGRRDGAWWGMGEGGGMVPGGGWGLVGRVPLGGGRDGAR